MRAHLGTALVIVLAATSSVAWAVPPPPPPKAGMVLVTPKPMLTAITMPTKWSVSNAFENDMHDAMDVAASSSLAGGTALAGFRFRFGNGDHKLRKMGVMPKDRMASFSYADNNGDDPFAAVASWAVINTARSGTVSAFGGGQFEIPIPGKQPGYKLVLSGFEFRRKDATDANVRSIGVWLNSDKSTARVMLMDDQGPDFRGFESTIGAALLGGLPIGELKVATDTILNAQGHLNRGETSGKYRAYAVTVQYAWVPDAAVVSTDIYTGTGRMPASGKTFPPNGVLQGFEFYFMNSDHYIMDVGVMGALMRPGPSLPSVLVPPNGEVIEYQDINRDDPIRWGVQFANLAPTH